MTLRAVLRPPAGSPAPDAILTCREVADWLQLTPRQVQRLGIPYFDLGVKNRRYRAQDVLAWLEAHRRNGKGRWLDKTGE